MSGWIALSILVIGMGAGLLCTLMLGLMGVLDARNLIAKRARIVHLPNRHDKWRVDGFFGWWRFGVWQRMESYHHKHEAERVVDEMLSPTIVMEKSR